MSYPSGFVQADLTGTTGGKLVKSTGEKWAQSATGVTFTFGTSNITITNATSVAIPAGEYYVSFGAVDINGSFNLTQPNAVQTKALS